MVSIKRKLLAALCSTLLMGLFFSLSIDGESDGAVEFIFVILIFSGIGTFTYGLLTSMLSDILSEKIARIRFLVAGLIHLACGALTFFIIGGYGFFALCAAALFFISDEVLNFRIRSWSPKGFAFQLTILIILGVGAWQLMQIEDTNENEAETNNTYLIPEGFEGTILTLYNIPGKPPLMKRDGNTLIPVAKKQFLDGLESFEYGITLTSTEEIETGITTYNYFYVSEEGKRSHIPQECINFGGGGSFTKNSGQEMRYVRIQVTKSDCGEMFLVNGSNRFDRQRQEVFSYWQDLLVDLVIPFHYNALSSHVPKGSIPMNAHRKMDGIPNF
ncbi:DUF6843 domain-containing protein [Pseudalkalibacillus hwajinpoensis]|uniref:DUF6843 domain-containing protein n=1 Tax=Guptibacillus hwajinpoensis TaxID=208199 RepID=A0A4U1MNR9_9BACL|nr:hypothetical protein [Pseudalkalibacillus hwajinpoensis]TKD72292.1 hypothetical protein FBF83_05745 [Pseudalkalibacillus hwajinpoensis]